MTGFPDLSGLSGAEKEALIRTLWQRLQAAEERIAELEAKLGRPPKTPRNSSVPPSRGAKPNTPKAAGQPHPEGRPGVARTLAAEPDRVVEAVAATCPHCSAPVSAAEQALQAVYDRVELPPIRPTVTRVRRHGGTCPCCRRAFTAPVPAGLEPGSPFGRSVEALAVYLRYVHAIGYERLGRMMADVFGVAISEGALANLLRRTRACFTAQAEAIKAEVRRAAVVCSDETSARVEGRSWWEWVVIGGRAVLHHLAPSRGRRVLVDLLAGARPRVWVSDLYGAQRGHAPLWQVCLAHQLRDAAYAIDAGDSAFAPLLKRVLLRAVAIGQRRATLKDGTLRRYAHDLDRRLDRAMAIEPIGRDGHRLRRRIARIRGHLFVFVTDRAVPFTNNVSERALRPSVIFRKVTGGFRSPWGAELFAAIRSVLDTGRRNGLSPLQAIGATLEAKPLFTPA